MNRRAKHSRVRRNENVLSNDYGMINIPLGYTDTVYYTSEKTRLARILSVRNTP